MGKMKDENDLSVISIDGPNPEPESKNIPAGRLESIDSPAPEIDVRRATHLRPSPRQGQMVQRLIDRPLLISELKREVAYLRAGKLGIVVVAEIFYLPEGHRASSRAGGWIIYQVTCLDRETDEELMAAFPRDGVLGVLETQRGGPKVYRTLDTLVTQLMDTIGANAVFQFNVTASRDKP